MKTYDAIVVGAGHNGLTTAAFLAKAGHRRGGGQPQSARRLDLFELLVRLQPAAPGNLSGAGAASPWAAGYAIRWFADLYGKR
jgi:glycine/D-amino acid oxidase-like deaminating enzyme